MTCICRLALQDISLAFLAGYPVDLAYKLHERRAKCLKELGDYGSADFSARECFESITGANMENDKKEKLMENIKKFINDLPKDPGATVTDVDSESSILLPRIANPNKQLPAFSEVIELKYEAGRGRFGVASRDIKLGKKFVTSANKCFNFSFV